MKEYKIEQFPKNKTITNLSKEQKELRRSQKKYIYKDLKTCNNCIKEQPISEYYVKDSKTGRRANKCRDCTMKDKGVIEIGKQRFAYKIADKGFRRCSICKNIKPFSEFTKNKGAYLGYANNCYKCQSALTLPWRKKQSDDITDWYIINYYGKKLGYKEFNNDLIEKLRLDIIESRVPKVKFSLDGKDFLSIRQFSLYVSKLYKLTYHCVYHRASNGFNEKECTMTRLEFVRNNKAKEVGNG